MVDGDSAEQLSMKTRPLSDDLLKKAVQTYAQLLINPVLRTSASKQSWVVALKQALEAAVWPRMTEHVFLPTVLVKSLQRECLAIGEGTKGGILKLNRNFINWLRDHWILTPI